jgi:hypothetical protein
MIRLRKLLVSAAVVGALAAVTGVATWAAFSATTANPANSFAVGTVALTDNDGNGTLLSLTNARPGDTTTGCIKVTYTGSLPADVKLFGSVSGALGQYLTLKVTRGTDAGSSFPSCTNFSPDTRDYIGQGGGVIYNGNLSDFPASYAAGITDRDDATGGTETWTASEVHAYKLEVTLQNNTSAQGQSANASFTWEARNQ